MSSTQNKIKINILNLSILFRSNFCYILGQVSNFSISNRQKKPFRATGVLHCLIFNTVAHHHSGYSLDGFINIWSVNHDDSEPAI